jgi:hypothetical protein
VNRQGGRDAEVRTAFVRLAGQEIELLEYQGVALRGDEPLRPFDVGAMHLALHVDNLDAALERIRRYGWQSQGTRLGCATHSRFLWSEQ